MRNGDTVTNNYESSLLDLYIPMSILYLYLENNIDLLIHFFYIDLNVNDV